MKVGLEQTLFRGTVRCDGDGWRVRMESQGIEAAGALSCASVPIMVRSSCE